MTYTCWFGILKLIYDLIQKFGYKFPSIVKIFLVIITSGSSIKFDVYILGAIFLNSPAFSNLDICLLKFLSLEEKMTS